MADDKNSFIVYAQWQENMDTFPEKVQNEIRKAIFFYAMGRELPELSPRAEGFFWGIKSQIDANNQKYEKIQQKRSEAGKKSAEARKKKQEKMEQKATKRTSVDFVEHNVNVNDNVNVNVNIPSNEGDIIHTRTHEEKSSSSIIPKLGEENEWVEAICMQHHLKPPEVEQWLQKFELHVQCSGTQHLGRRDAKSHFHSWLTKELTHDNKRNHTQGTGVRGQEARHLEQLRELAGGDDERLAILEATYKNRS